LAEDGELLDGTVVEHWATTISVIARGDQRLLIQSGFPSAYVSKIEQLCSLIAAEINGGPSLTTDDDFTFEISRMPDLANSLEVLMGVISEVNQRLLRTSELAERRGRFLERKYVEFLGDSEDQTDLPDDSISKQPFDLQRLFADL
jgi:hypothetical protein